MTPAELERVKEIVANNDPATALALLELEFRPKRTPPVSPERLQEMVGLALRWYAQHGGKREYIATDATDEHGKPVANDDEVSALRRALKHDKECQRRLHRIDGRGRRVGPH